ncbi:MAG: hypothetical protein JW725_04415 [Candidatus Babeliaceae bacterium]|nr:hypothetical protein [Candidatus Babeliaceae bacterium]
MKKFSLIVFPFLIASSLHATPESTKLTEAKNKIAQTQGNAKLAALPEAVGLIIEEAVKLIRKPNIREKSELVNVAAELISLYDGINSDEELSKSYNSNAIKEIRGEGGLFWTGWQWIKGSLTTAFSDEERQTVYRWINTIYAGIALRNNLPKTFNAIWENKIPDGLFRNTRPGIGVDGFFSFIIADLMNPKNISLVRTFFKGKTPNNVVIPSNTDALELFTVFLKNHATKIGNNIERLFSILQPWFSTYATIYYKNISDYLKKIPPEQVASILSFQNIKKPFLRLILQLIYLEASYEDLFTIPLEPITCEKIFTKASAHPLSLGPALETWISLHNKGITYRTGSPIGRFLALTANRNIKESIESNAAAQLDSWITLIKEQEARIYKEKVKTNELIYTLIDSYINLLKNRVTDWSQFLVAIAPSLKHQIKEIHGLSGNKETPYTYLFKKLEAEGLPTKRDSLLNELKASPIKKKVNWDNIIKSLAQTLHQIATKQKEGLFL